MECVGRERNQVAAFRNSPGLQPGEVSPSSGERLLFHVGREAGRRHGLDGGGGGGSGSGGLLHGLDAVHFHGGAFLSSVSLLSLPFEGSCDFLKSPTTGLGDFEKGEDQENNEEASEDDKNIGA